jgi:hypothetical protein
MQHVCILAGVRDIQQRYPAARLERPHDLAERLFALRTSMNIVENQARYDDIKGTVPERELTRICVSHLNSVGDSFCSRVHPGRFGAVVCLVGTMPNIDTDRFPARQALGRGDKQQASATSNIENQFIPPPWDSADQLVACAELADLTAPQHRGRSS